MILTRWIPLYAFSFFTTLVSLYLFTTSFSERDDTVCDVAVGFNTSMCYRSLEYCTHSCSYLNNTDLCLVLFTVLTVLLLVLLHLAALWKTSLTLTWILVGLEALGMVFLISYGISYFAMNQPWNFYCEYKNSSGCDYDCTSISVKMSVVWFILLCISTMVSGVFAYAHKYEEGKNFSSLY